MQAECRAVLASEANTVAIDLAGKNLRSAYEHACIINAELMSVNRTQAYVECSEAHAHTDLLV
jgi:hypothetical protein